MPTLKIDIHVHTNYSDSTGSVAEVIQQAKRRGLDGLAITDHNTMEGVNKALAMKSGLLIIPGEEVDTIGGDMLVLGIRDAIPPGLLASEVIARVHSQKGLVIVPHPTIPFFGGPKKPQLRALPVDGLEVFSAFTPLANYFARKNLDMARELGLPVLAGSDSHFPETVGDAYTLVDADRCDVSSIIEAIRQGRTSLGCRPSRLFFKLRIIRLWQSRFGSKKEGVAFHRGPPLILRAISRPKSIHCLTSASLGA